jgi:hypothetical protein
MPNDSNQYSEQFKISILRRLANFEGTILVIALKNIAKPKKIRIGIQNG